MKKRKVDAVIIGSGVGGLCCAARLAHKGMKVIVIERLPLLGGRFSTRIVKGFKLTTGAMMVPHGPASAFQEAFDLMNAPMAVHAPITINIRLSHGEYELMTQGFGGTLNFAFQDDQKAQELAGHFMHALTWSPPSDQITFKDWLLQYTHNETVLKMFQGLSAAFVGVNSWEVPAGEIFHIANFFAKGVAFGVGPRGNLVLMDSLGDAIIENGGVIQKETDCLSIVVEKEKVCGVVIETAGKQEMIEADFVISNTGPTQTVRLAGETNFEKSYLTLLNEHNFTVPIVYMAISSKEPFYDRSAILNFGNTRCVCFMETPTLFCPELAPEGRHLTIVFGVPEHSTGPLKLQDTINRALLDLQENFPSFKTDADVIHIGTHHGDWPVLHRWPGYPTPTKTSVENLYNVGDGCMPRGIIGLEGCAVSAKEVAQDINARV